MRRMFVCKAYQNTSVVASAVEEDAGELKRPAQEQVALINRFTF